jgi:hypothetical protein
MAHLLPGLAATIIVLTTVFALIVSPMCVKRIADKVAIGGFVLGLGVIACLIAAMWIAMAIGAAQLLGLVPFLLLCILLQRTYRRG